MITDKQELELLGGFRRLCPADKNTVLTAVSMAVTAEDAVRRELGTPACGCGNGKKSSYGKRESVA